VSGVYQNQNVVNGLRPAQWQSHLHWLPL
jgi:hypothetical protein